MKVQTITRGALFLAMAIALSYLEMLLPPLPFLPPGVKLGLSNIVVMYCLFFLSTPMAFLTALLKSLFVFLMRGTISGLFSLLGGMLSVSVMALLSRLRRPRLSYLLLSVAGAVSHNMGQLMGVYLMLTKEILFYVPVLIISGIIMGCLTALLLKVLLPALRRVKGFAKQERRSP